MLKYFLTNVECTRVTILNHVHFPLSIGQPPPDLLERAHSLLYGTHLFIILIGSLLLLIIIFLFLIVPTLVHIFNINVIFISLQ